MEIYIYIYCFCCRWNFTRHYTALYCALEISTAVFRKLICHCVHCFRYSEAFQLFREATIMFRDTYSDIYLLVYKNGIRS